ncbi:hypothetical protein J437_LFUL018612 [Ladona fulva]|uniref:C2H2-type domain-containing protein n=1 Tax=Ladona fulva TaxID=123851 RepID=A0A8K0PA56_LADFU|nr:hypothetical protein J437_LFUL018612 [Ladona fulva]
MYKFDILIRSPNSVFADGLECILPMYDKAVIEAAKEEAAEEELDPLYDVMHYFDLPFIVRAYPIEAEPSVVEEEKQVLEPIDVPSVSKGEGRKLRPRKPTNYRLDCPSPGLERDFSDSGSSNFIPEKGNGYCSSSESSYGSRRNSGDKSLTAPEGAIHPKGAEGFWTSNPIEKERKRKPRVQGRKSRVRKKGSGGQLGNATSLRKDRKGCEEEAKGETVDDGLSLQTFEVTCEGNKDVGVSVGLGTTQNVVKGLSKGAAADATTDHGSGWKECRNGEPSEATSRQPSGFSDCNNSDRDWWESDEDDNFSETSMFIIDPCEADITPERLAKTEYLCEICGRILISGPSLFTHKKIHSGDRRFSCEKCEKSFLSKEQLQNHMSSHGDYRPFKCDKCPKAFKLERHLEQHGISHTGKRKYPCPHCEDSFRTRWQFKSHQKKHEGKVFWKCDCGQKCRSWDDLEKHLAEHKQNRTFKCEVCSMVFKRKAYLFRHFHIHSKPYKCSICDQGFARDSERIDHESTHAGERKYQCDQCGMKFFRRFTFWKHRRDIHIDVQKYRCRFCSFRTKYKFEWKKHEGKHRKRRGESVDS